MKIICSTVAVIGAVACAAVGLAGPAAADPVDGQYNAMMIGGNNGKEVGSTVVWGINGCGPDCVHLATSGPGVDLHREGPLWRGAGADGCNWSMMNDSLYVSITCPDSDYVIGMTRI